MRRLWLILFMVLAPLDCATPDNAQPPRVDIAYLRLGSARLLSQELKLANSNTLRESQQLMALRTNDRIEALPMSSVLDKMRPYLLSEQEVCRFYDSHHAKDKSQPISVCSHRTHGDNAYRRSITW